MNSYLENLWNKILHLKKCNCGHPFNWHQCYEHGSCIHGVCMAPLFSDDVCCCDGYNSMWNKEFPPDKPWLRDDDCISVIGGERK